jgi:hypothetical protein
VTGGDQGAHDAALITAARLDAARRDGEGVQLLDQFGPATAKNFAAGQWALLPSVSAKIGDFGTAAALPMCAPVPGIEALRKRRSVRLPGAFCLEWLQSRLPQRRLDGPRKFGDWEFGVVAFGSTDLNEPILGYNYAKQSQIAVGGLIGKSFGGLILQTTEALVAEITARQCGPV